MNAAQKKRISNLVDKLEDINFELHEELEKSHELPDALHKAIDSLEKSIEHLHRIEGEIEETDSDYRD
jgi:predicted RNase H-like nuclease (RuvC/YqgF family)